MNKFIHNINSELLTGLFISTIFLWIGAFLFMRSRTSIYLKLTGLAMFTVWFYVSGALMFDSAGDIATARFWSHWGWATSLTVILWFHAVSYLTGFRKQGTLVFKILVLGGYMTAIALIGVSSLSDLVFSVIELGPPSTTTAVRFFTKPGPLYPVFLAHVLLYLGLSFALLAKMYIRGEFDPSQKRRRQDASLLAGSLILLLSAGFIGIFVQYQISGNIQESHVQPFLLLGLLMVSLASVGYEGAMEASGMSRQFMYSSAGALFVVALLSLVLYLTNATIVQTLAMIALAVAAYSYHDAAVNSAEHLIYAGALTLSKLTGNTGENLGRRISSRHRLALSDHDDTERLEQVEFALRNYSDDDLLALSPLSDLRLIQDIEYAGSRYGELFSHDVVQEMPDESERIGGLRKLLADGTYHLKPHGLDDPGTDVFDDVWGAYAACLYYVEGGRDAEAIWQKKWRSQSATAGLDVAKPLELRLLTWRKNENQGLHRKWRNKYFADGAAGIARFIMELEASAPDWESPAATNGGDLK